MYKELVINYREGATNREGGSQVKLYPYEKGGGKRFSHAEGGGAQTVWSLKF